CGAWDLRLATGRSSPRHPARPTSGRRHFFGPALPAGRAHREHTAAPEERPGSRQVPFKLSYSLRHALLGCRFVPGLRLVPEVAFGFDSVQNVNRVKINLDTERLHAVREGDDYAALAADFGHDP